jgi:hypothetical protein
MAAFIREWQAIVRISRFASTANAAKACHRVKNGAVSPSLGMPR